jgi:hypothetical protein
MSLDRKGWRLRVPETPPLLSDERLLEYRHPAEHRMLALALGLGDSAGGCGVV